MVSAIDRDAEIWMNRSPKSGHWLDIALRGTKSNRDGIGARIKVVTKSGVQYNHMTTSVGYASSSDGPVHFGLGPDRRVEEIEIHWPSGAVQTLRGVDGDRRIEVTESESKTETWRRLLTLKRLHSRGYLGPLACCSAVSRSTTARSLAPSSGLCSL